MDRLLELLQNLARFFPRIGLAIFFCLAIVPIIGIVWFLIRTRSFAWSTKGLIIVTMIADMPGAVIRAFLSVLTMPFVLIPVMFFSIISAALLTLFIILVTGRVISNAFTILSSISVGIAVPAAIISAIIWFSIWSWWPLVMSFLNLMGIPTFAWYTITWLGAYPPTKRQRDWYKEATDQIKARATIPFTIPVVIHMLERTDETILTIGSDLYISQAAMKSPDFAMLLADELYLYNSGESRIIEAMRRLAIGPLHMLARAIGQLAPGALMGGMHGDTVDRALPAIAMWIFSGALALAGGGIGLFIFSPLWAIHARGMYLKKDDYAAALGYKEELKSYIDRKVIIPIVYPIPFFLSPEPHTEERHGNLS